MKNLSKTLTNLMTTIADYLGRPRVFLLVAIIVVSWFLVAPLFEYDVWFDIMDVTVFLTTFLFLFVIQSSQNADTRAMQDKLDDIIEALPKAHSEKEGEEKDMKRGAGPS